MGKKKNKVISPSGCEGKCMTVWFLCFQLMWFCYPTCSQLGFTNLAAHSCFSWNICRVSTQFNLYVFVVSSSTVKKTFLSFFPIPIFTRIFSPFPNWRWGKFHFIHFHNFQYQFLKKIINIQYQKCSKYCNQVKGTKCILISCHAL